MNNKIVKDLKACLLPKLKEYVGQNFGVLTKGIDFRVFQYNSSPPYFDSKYIFGVLLATIGSIV